MWLPDRHGFILFLLLSVDLSDPAEHWRTESHKRQHIKLKGYIQRYYKLWSVWSVSGYLVTALATVLSLTGASSSSCRDGSGQRLLCEHHQVTITTHTLWNGMKSWGIQACDSYSEDWSGPSWPHPQGSPVSSLNSASHLPYLPCSPRCLQARWHWLPSLHLRRRRLLRLTFHQRVKSL